MITTYGGPYWSNVKDLGFGYHNDLIYEVILDIFDKRSIRYTYSKTFKGAIEDTKTIRLSYGGIWVEIEDGFTSSVRLEDGEYLLFGCSIVSKGSSFPPGYLHFEKSIKKENYENRTEKV